MGGDAEWGMGLGWDVRCGMENGTGTGTLWFAAKLTIPAGYRCQCAPIIHTGTVHIKMIWPPDTPSRTKNIVHPEVLLDEIVHNFVLESELDHCPAPVVNHRS